MSSQLYFVLLSLFCSIICHRSKYKLNFSIRSMSNSQLLNNHHGSHALFSFISLDSKCIPYVFNLYHPVYSFVDFNKSSLKNNNNNRLCIFLIQLFTHWDILMGEVQFPLCRHLIGNKYNNNCNYNKNKTIIGFLY